MIGIGISNSVGAYRSFVDPAASAFFAATGITGTTEQQAVNTLVTSLKSAGLWSKMKAVYPFVTDNRNLLSYTEDFGNGYWDKSNSLVTTNTTTAPNGTTTADTLNEGTTTAWHRIWNFSSGSNVITGSTYTYSIYLKAGTETVVQLNTYNIYASNSFNYANFDLQNGVLGTYANCTPNIESVGNGWYRCSITQTSVVTSTSFVYATFANGNASAGERPSYTGTNDTFYLWGAQLELGSTATTYQPIATTQQSYISNQFKYNLVNPVDSDAAFRGVFNGGWTFSNQGALPNGTNGYMDTKFIPASNLTINDQSYSVYSRTNTAAGNKRELGLNYFGEISVIAKFTGDLFYPVIGGTYPNVSNADSRGHYIANRTDSTNIKGYKNGSLILNALQTPALPTTYGIYIGCRNDNGVANQYTDRQLAFSHLGQGLTDTEATALYNAVQTFNTSLSRQV